MTSIYNFISVFSIPSFRIRFYNCTHPYTHRVLNLIWTHYHYLFSFFFFQWFLWNVLRVWKLSKSCIYVVCTSWLKLKQMNGGRRCSFLTIWIIHLLCVFAKYLGLSSQVSVNSDSVSLSFCTTSSQKETLHCFSTWQCVNTKQTSNKGAQLYLPFTHSYL